jgi:hypothetical protein
MNELNAQLVSKENCAQDLKLQNPLVTQAHADFTAYGIIRQATCMTISDPSYKRRSVSNCTAISPKYCYTAALYTSADANDAYLYLMPLGIGYPGGDIRPTCTDCVSQTLRLFYQYTGNASNSISYTL